MAISLISSNGNTNPTNPTTTFTLPIGTVQANDILVLYIVNKGATASPSVTDNETPSNPWTRKAGGNGTSNASVWWKRATANSSGRTITVSGLTTNGRGALSVYRGVRIDADPFNQLTGPILFPVQGTNVHNQPFTPTVDGCWCVLAMYNHTTVTTPQNPSCVNLGVLPIEAFSGNNNGCCLRTAGESQPTAANTGNFQWGFNPTAAGISIAFALTPAPPPITGTLAATEIRDTASVAASVTGNVGRLIATEIGDAAAFAVVASGYRQSVQVFIGGVAVGVRQENQSALTPTDEEFDITATRAWTPTDFRDGAFSVYLGSHAVDAPFEGHWDCTSVRVTYVLPPTRTGTLDAVEAPDAAAFVGEGPPVDGTLAATEGDDLASFVAALVTEGALIGIEANDVAEWAGYVASDGTLAATESPDIVAFTGEGLAINGGLAATEAPDTAAITGTVEAAGTLAASEAADSAAIVGGIVATGTLAATDAADAAVFTGGAVIHGALAATEGGDLASFIGEGIGINGVLAATEDADVAIFAATVATTGILAASEAPDAAAFSGEAVAIIGALAATEAADAAAITGGTIVTGTLAATETPDAAAFVGKTIVTGTLAATDAPDTAIAVGGVAWVAKLAAVEEGDGAAFTGDVFVEGALAATEAADAAAFVGAVVVEGTLEAVEEPDKAHFFQTSISGFFAALEASDNAIIVGTVGDYGIDIIGDEDPHTIKGAATAATITGTAGTPTIKGTV